MRVLLRAKHLLCAILVLASYSLGAAQLGPYFPTHRYPTDQSFHLGYGFGLMRSSADFVGPKLTLDLEGEAELQRIRHRFTVEYQPTRKLSVGAFLHLDQLKLESALAETVSGTRLSDQLLFMEYRFFDEPGRSLGAAFLLKVPFYRNPNVEDIAGTLNNFLLFGDAQTDMTFLMTSEYWPADIFRIRANLGYTFRTEQYSGELPLMFSVGLVSPRFDIEVKVLGNLSLNQDSFDEGSADLQLLRDRFANSSYALSANPWVLAIEPEVSYWYTRNWALVANFRYALMGNNSPAYYSGMAGFTYRWAYTDTRVRRSIREVDIGVDQERGIFPGER